MSNIIILELFFITFLFSLNQCQIRYEDFGQEDEAKYMGAFDTLIKDSYSAPLPSALVSTCRHKPQEGSSVTVQSIKSSMTSSELQTFCGTNSICTISSGNTVTMNSNLNVAALVVSGTLIWNDQTQSSVDQWLCAGYVAVSGGQFNMNVTSKNSYIYIKDNGMRDRIIYTRAFGSYNLGKIFISGRPMARTWSLISERAIYGMSTISLLHNPVEMGWKIGDRIVIAPTEIESKGDAEEFKIGGFDENNSIKLLTKSGTANGIISSFFESKARYTGRNMSAQLQAEVINLSRNIIITGDDFKHTPCIKDIEGSGEPPENFQKDHCSCWAGIGKTQCTLGLHTLAVGPGAVLSLKYTRIEKCGQRGIMGKYCIHLHLVSSCPDCKIIGNAIEYGHQRGTVIHGSHLATIENNVYNDIRGSIIYVEDGNELYNRIFYNVGICPWAKVGEKRGCTIPGTNNAQADTKLNQAGLWGLSFTNYVIGNRFANNFNGMLYQEQGFDNGRGEVKGFECPALQQIGRLEGNTFHSSGRFGTYVLAFVYPKKIDRTIDNNGLAVLNSCKDFTSTGEDNGLPASFMNNFDYGNAFVGQYNAGDLQYRFHSSINNQNLIYWKETKNFQDGCSSHLADSYFEGGNLALPGGHGTFILENMIFNNQVQFESSHHCQVGVTGVLCMPTYVFVNMQWNGVINDAFPILRWGPNNGAMFTLGPDDEKNLNGNKLFPRGFCSIVHPYWTYLLELDNGQTCFSSDAVAALLNEDPIKFKRRYDNIGAIFCKKPVRRLEVFSFNPPMGSMKLELWQNGKFLSSVMLNHFAIGPDGQRPVKQGYSATVIPGLTHQYKLSVNGGNVPLDWIIEFSDPIFGNRWKRDEIDLVVTGRNCPYPVHSQHDRRYIWGGNDYLRVKGRGACTSNPDMSPVNCKSQPKLSNIETCPGKCKTFCNNGYCDCASGECLCNPGFSGKNCTIDVCGAAGCVNGHCAAHYLGGELPVSHKPCICQDGWYGEKCDSNKPISTSAPQPICFNGCYFFPDTEISGAEIGVIQTSDPKVCCAACAANPSCNSWNINVICFLKAGIQRVPSEGKFAGLKCSAGTGVTSNTNAPIVTGVTSTSHCDSKCKGTYPYGCNSGFAFGYCNSGGGCYYESTTDPNWCCFKGCSAPQTGTTNAPATTISTVSTNAPATTISTISTNPSTQSCNSKCKGTYPYGCNSGFAFGYCNSDGGCYYESTNDPNWCCFKGCSAPQTVSTNAPATTISTVSTNAPTQSCESKCQSAYPHGCNSNFALGYCNSGGGCSYSTMSDPSWCCFKGCSSSQTVSTNAPTITNAPVVTNSQTQKCDSLCRGSYPYGCNTGFPIGYCNNNGGCAYTILHDPNWCCYKGC